jgi:hypothetical protein
LLEAGIKLIHSLGVDGGTGYSAWFDATDKLANGRTTFDDQFPEIQRLLAKRPGVVWKRLGEKANARKETNADHHRLLLSAR